VPSLISIGDIATPTTKNLVLWKMDENFYPISGKDIVGEDEFLIVLRTRNMREEKIVPRWKTAVNVITSSGKSGWVGIGWLRKV
jgi:hypothetical protein